MSGFQVLISGNKAIADAMAEYEQRVLEEIQWALVESAQEALAHAKALCPIDTGRLRDSLKVEFTPTTATISTDVPYALFVEFGHHTRSGSWVPAQSFLIPAWDLEGSRLREKLASIIGG